MIDFRSVTFTYPDDASPVLRDVNFSMPEGELWVVVGTTGSGKSTLLRCVNGLVPHFSGGYFSGEVTVAGRSTRTHAPRDLADVVGYVGQDPLAAFVTDVVEDEIAYGMENLGVEAAAMRRRVEDALDLLDLADLRRRPLHALSGGQQQRVAIAAALAPATRVLVLDEPTSSLDPAGAEEVLAALTRLVHDLGVAVLVAEHRLERVLHYADRVVHVPGRHASVVVGDPAAVLEQTSVAPPVVELARAVGWRPIPLSVRDARRVAAPLRDRLSACPPPLRTGGNSPPPGRAIASSSGVVARYGEVTALRDVSIDVRAGEVLALMGRNGAGKSTLLSLFAGLRRPDAGRVEVRGAAPAERRPRDLVRDVGLVPQDPGLLLYAQRVDEEMTTADRDAGLSPGATAAVAARIVPGIDSASHPRDLSEGQRLGLALAIVLAPEPALVLLDEPTRGLDYSAKKRLAEIIRELAVEGRAVVVATHDVELVAEVADRVVLLADGEVTGDGPARDVVTHSPVFAPQVAKILSPLTLLTVGEVREALAAS